MTKPLLKYCGIRTKKDVEIGAQSQADYLGFNFFKGSKRYISPEKASMNLCALSEDPVQQLAGVFVNANLDEIMHAVNVMPLDVIQCHGDETPEILNEIKKRTGKKIWKAIRLSENWQQEIDQYSTSVDGILIDAKVKGHYGGTGQVFDWGIIPDFEKLMSYYGLQGWVAGGINLSNIEKLLDYQPAGIDLASGIEKNGYKSLEIIRQLEGKVNKYEKLS